LCFNEKKSEILMSHWGLYYKGFEVVFQ